MDEERKIICEEKESKNVSKLILKKHKPYLEIPKSLEKITLVLDLDQTLIFSSRIEIKDIKIVCIKTIKQFKENKKIYKISVPYREGNENYYVIKRPHSDDFLKNVSKWFNVVIFTASSESYANKVLNLFDDITYDGKLFRQHCDENHFDGKIKLQKDLDKLGRKISRVLLIEDSKEVIYSKHLKNVIYVSSWKGNQDDVELLNLKNQLCKMKDDEEIYSFVENYK
eukprot:gene9616-1820_t